MLNRLNAFPPAFHALLVPLALPLAHLTELLNPKKLAALVARVEQGEKPTGGLGQMVRRMGMGLGAQGVNIPADFVNERKLTQKCRWQLVRLAQVTTLYLYYCGGHLGVAEAILGIEQLHQKALLQLIALTAPGADPNALSRLHVQELYQRLAHFQEKHQLNFDKQNSRAPLTPRGSEQACIQSKKLLQSQRSINLLSQQLQESREAIRHREERIQKLSDQLRAACQTIDEKEEQLQLQLQTSINMTEGVNEQSQQAVACVTAKVNQAARMCESTYMRAQEAPEPTTSQAVLRQLVDQALQIKYLRRNLAKVLATVNRCTRCRKHIPSILL